MAGVDLSGGYVRLWRKALESQVFNSRDSDLWKVWTWCMMEANWKPRIKDGQEIMVGQLTTGRFQGADRLKLSPSKFYRCLKRLEKWKQISLKSNTQFTTITICNWIIYNPPIEESEHSSGQRVDTPLNTQVNTPKEGKEREEGKEINAAAQHVPQSSQSFQNLMEKWNAISGVTHCRVATEKRQSAFRQRIKNQFWFDHFEQALEKVSQSQFCKGHGKQGWVADLDWFLRPDTVAKIMEGKYDHLNNKPECNQQQNGKPTYSQRMDSVWDSLKRKDQDAQS